MNKLLRKSIVLVPLILLLGVGFFLLQAHAQTVRRKVIRTPVAPTQQTVFQPGAPVDEAAVQTKEGVEMPYEAPKGPFGFYYFYPVAEFPDSISGGISAAKQALIGLQIFLYDFFKCTPLDPPEPLVPYPSIGLMEINDVITWAYAHMSVQNCNKGMKRKYHFKQSEGWEVFLKKCFDRNYQIFFSEDNGTKWTCGSL